MLFRIGGVTHADPAKHSWYPVVHRWSVTPVRGRPRLLRHRSRQTLTTADAVVAPCREVRDSLSDRFDAIARDVRAFHEDRKAEAGK